MQKNANEYYCEYCDFLCYKKSNYEKHIQTKKHASNIFSTSINDKNAEQKKYVCDFCNKSYKDRTGLWRHKKICKNVISENTCIITPDILPSQTENMINNITSENIVELIKQNNEFKELLIEQNKQIIELTKKTSVNNITQYNTNNNKFNLNFFLNEKCKDALNIKDFINSIDLKLKDLEIVGKLGYVEGISQIIVNGLKELDVYKRPMHCSDIKREVLYVKDENKWEKENEDKDKIKSAIKEIANKNIKQIPDWIKEHPHHKDYNHHENDDYLNIITSCMAGNEVVEDMNKIIKNVSKEVVIDK